MKQLRLLNLNCREASRLASKGMDRQLSFIERLGLRLHLLICAGCRAWRRQVLVIREVLRSRMWPLAERDAQPAKLAEQARRRILEAIQSDS